MEPFLTALEGHEAGHVEIAKRAAEKVEQALAQMPPQPSCDTMQQAAERVFDDVWREERDVQKRFDRETRSGVEQGAALRIRRRSRR